MFQPGEDEGVDGVAHPLCFIHRGECEALRWQELGRPPAVVRGDVLARALAITPGPALGELLAAIEEEVFVGSVRTAEEAIAFAAERIA